MDKTIVELPKDEDPQVLNVQQRAEDIWGNFLTISAVPTDVPKNLQSQVRLYVNGTDIRLYVYDIQNNQWRYMPAFAFPLPVSNGGTGATTLTGVLLGNGTSAFTAENPLTVPHGGTGQATLTQHGVVIGGAAAAVNITTAGTTGQVLTSNGASADPTFQTPVGFKSQETTDFSVLTNYDIAAGGATPGAITRSTNGLEVNASVGAGTGFNSLRWHAFQTMTGATNNYFLFATSFNFSCVFCPATLSSGATKGTFFAGVGNLTVAATGFTFTSDHIGFALVSDGTNKKLYGTQADGTTQTKTALVNFGDQDSVMVYFKVNGNISVDYYYNINNSGWNSVLGVTANFPRNTILASNVFVQIAGSTDNNSNVNQVFVQNATLTF